MFLFENQRLILLFLEKRQKQLNDSIEIQMVNGNMIFIFVISKRQNRKIPIQNVIQIDLCSFISFEWNDLKNEFFSSYLDELIVPIVILEISKRLDP